MELDNTKQIAKHFAASKIESDYWKICFFCDFFGLETYGILRHPEIVVLRITGQSQFGTSMKLVALRCGTPRRCATS